VVNPSKCASLVPDRMIRFARSINAEITGLPKKNVVIGESVEVKFKGGEK